MIASCTNIEQIKGGIWERNFLRLARCLMLLAAFGTNHVMAADPNNEQEVYFWGSMTSVRVAPNEKAPIAGKLPIGTSAWFHGRPTDVLNSDHQYCKGADKLTSSKWFCICTNFYLDDSDGGWCGWVASDLVGTSKPRLKDLLSVIDKTPPTNLTERRILAERATALDPLDPQAQQHLLLTLDSLQDGKAYKAASLSFDQYRADAASIPFTSPVAYVFVYANGRIEPIAEVKGQKITLRSFDPSKQFEYRAPGQFFRFYAEGRRVGKVATQAFFDCRVTPCPYQTLAKPIFLDAGAGLTKGLATNAEVNDQESVQSAIASRDKNDMRRFAIDWLNSVEMAANRKLAFRKVVQDTRSAMIAVGSLASNENGLLIGNWAMGTMGDEKYGSDTDYFETLLVLAERQQGGSYRRVLATGELTSNGCVYFDHLDIDNDGTTEIVFKCDKVEGTYGFAIAQRVRGVWQFSFGPNRN